MKSIFLILALLGLASCKQNNSTRHCEINGEEVDCDSFRQYQRSDAIKLHASIAVSANVQLNEIEILENAQDQATDEEGRECSVRTSVGDTLLKNSDGTLSITSEDQFIKFIPGSSKEEWTNTFYDHGRGARVITTLKISQKKVFISAECAFKKKLN